MPELLEPQTIESTSRTKKNRKDWTKHYPRASLFELGVSPVEWTRLRKLCQVAKDRCVNTSCKAYAGYGGRGITFRFSTGSEMAEWILRNIGLRPSELHSIDRVDNNKGYEPNNLRWATRKEQNTNKKQYVCWAHGNRIRKLCDLRRDLCYETIRSWITQGMSDEEILKRAKTTSGRPRIRYSGLRPPK